MNWYNYLFFKENIVIINKLLFKLYKKKKDYFLVFLIFFKKMLK